ncbi:MAG: hypothetical protein P0116_06700 [Candidatus Nitrosocosmicus sp.]|nr:hypothetical protein [Candidatus Nitrosocosmicus sp.]
MKTDLFQKTIVFLKGSTACLNHSKPLSKIRFVYQTSKSFSEQGKEGSGPE